MRADQRILAEIIANDLLDNDRKYDIQDLMDAYDLNKTDAQNLYVAIHSEVNKPKIKDFEKDLIDFISNHKYLKEQDTSVEVMQREDETQIKIPTVNGEYEQIEIKITYIP